MFRAMMASGGVRRAVRSLVLPGLGSLTVAAGVLVSMLVTGAPGRAGMAAVEVREFTPTGQTTPATNFTVTFTRDVVPDSLVGRSLGPGGTGAPIRFTPEIPGRFRWIAPDRLRFYPDVTLAPSTVYAAEVSGRALRELGFSLEGATTFGFATHRLRVDSAYLGFQYDRELERRTKLVGTVSFNCVVDPDRFVARTTITGPGGERIGFRVLTREPAAIMELEVVDPGPQDADQDVELRISGDLEAVGGNLDLGQTYLRKVQLPGVDALKVESIQPRRESGDQQAVEIRFNLPVLMEDAGAHVSLDPPVDARITTEHDRLILRGPFDTSATYRITVREGLLAVDGSRLARGLTQAITFLQEDIRPQVDFVGDGMYLVRPGHLTLGLSTVNVERVTLEIDRVYPNNLVAILNSEDPAAQQGWGWWGGDLQLEAIGRRVYETELDVPVRRNQEVVTPIPLQSHLDEAGGGIFRVTAREYERGWNMNRRWAVVTDLGIVAKEAGDDLWIWVNSLTGLDPVRGAEIHLYSQNNQLLATAHTDGDGIAVVTGYGAFTETFTPFLITAERENDFSFLDLSRRRIPLADFDVGGRPSVRTGHEAFVYNQRDVYRPGETARLGAIVRGAGLTVPEPFPVLLEVRGPDGRLFAEQRARLDTQGGVDFGVELPDYAMTGLYTARLLIGDEKEIGRTTLSCEEFMPDRMKVVVEAERDAYAPGDTISVSVTGMTLFGPPAAGRRVEGKIDIEAAPFQPEGYRSFQFGDAEQEFARVSDALPEARLDDAGHARLRHPIPTGLAPPAALQAVIGVTVLETGGRGVTAYRVVPIHPYETYVGLRGRDEGYAEPGVAYPVEAIVVDPDGRSVADHELEISLYQVNWNTIWRRDGRGRYRYVSEKLESLESEQRVVSGAGPVRFDVTPGSYGQYRVVVRDAVSGGRSAIMFYSSGWGYAPWAMENPDRIELELDRESYRAGDEARVLVKAPFPGKLLVTVERDELFDRKIYALDGNTAEIRLPIAGDYAPNVYVSAHLIRSVPDLESDDSARAFGVVPLVVEAGAHRLAVDLAAPERTEPRGSLAVDFQVRGGQGTPFVTVAAVDEGILLLTDFASPDPFEFFLGKKQLEVATVDLYGVVLPEIDAALFSLPGDGVGEDLRRRHTQPPSVRRVKPVAFWSGAVETDAEGRGRVSFDIPEFNGTLRVMAVAWAGDAFGSSDTRVLVRDPIVMTPSFPRFVAPGDDFTVPVSVFNGTGVDGDFQINMTAEGPITFDSSPSVVIRIADGKEELVAFRLRTATTTGSARFVLSAAGAGARTASETELPIRAPVPFTTIAGSGSVAAGDTAAFTLPAGFVPGTASYQLVVSPLPAARFSGSLQYLLGYPHGCIEQTTSRVFPLLYFDDLARVAEPEIFVEGSAAYYIEEGIARLERMQLPSGAFAYWPGGAEANEWSTIYASHFLTEARRAGHDVTDRVHDAMLDRVRRIARGYRSDDVASLETAAYAAYVLALAGRPERATQSYLRSTVLDRLPAHARYHLAGAFAHAGDQATARSLLPVAASPPVGEVKRETGGNFNSPIRTRAIMLGILAEVDPGHPQIPVLVEELSASAESGRWYTTQENAYAFLALGKVCRSHTPPDYTGRLRVGGSTIASFDPEGGRYAGKDWAGRDVRIELRGSGTAYYYWRADGLPGSLDVDEFDHDLVVRRSYRNRRGVMIDPAKGFQQGDLIVAQLDVRAPTEALENVAVVDLLPAGLEIENPRLESREDVGWIRDASFRPQSVDIRDDRLVLYGSVPAGKPQRFYYALRAVTAGSFALPPVRAEAMYAPMKASVANSGRITVWEPGAGGGPGAPDEGDGRDAGAEGDPE